MKRIQRKRTKGWRMPKNTVYVGRGTKYGNPYKVFHDKKFDDYEVLDITFDNIEDAHAYVVTLYKMEMLKNVRRNPNYYDALKGKNLACFCPLNLPCHVDAIIEFLELPL